MPFMFVRVELCTSAPISESALDKLFDLVELALYDMSTKTLRESNRI